MLQQEDRQIEVKDVFIMPTDGLDPTKSQAPDSLVVVEGKDGHFYAYYGRVSNNSESLTKAVNFANRVLESANGIKRSFWNRLDTDWVKRSYPYCDYR